jgi:hypothetical protein
MNSNFKKDQTMNSIGPDSTPIPQCSQAGGKLHFAVTRSWRPIGSARPRAKSGRGQPRSALWWGARWNR